MARGRVEGQLRGGRGGAFAQACAAMRQRGTLGASGGMRVDSRPDQTLGSPGLHTGKPGQIFKLMEGPGREFSRLAHLAQTSVPGLREGGQGSDAQAEISVINRSMANKAARTAAAAVGWV